MSNLKEDNRIPRLKINRLFIHDLVIFDMKFFFGVVTFIILLKVNSFAGVTTGYKLGKGPLKITKNTADILEYFFSGGTKGFYAEKQENSWKPGIIAVSVDGAYDSFFRHPYHVNNVDNKRYGAIAIKQCKKKSGQECFLFANGYKIVWDNGSDKKKRKLKRKDIKAGKTIALLTELGFYDGDRSSATSTPKVNKKKEVKKVVKKYELKGERSIAVSWDGYNNLIAGTVEFDETDYKGTLNLPLPNNDGICEGSYSLQEDGKGTWQIACTNNMGAAGTLRWTKDGGVTGSGRDHDDKKVKFTVSKKS